MQNVKFVKLHGGKFIQFTLLCHHVGTTTAAANTYKQNLFIGQGSMEIDKYPVDVLLNDFVMSTKS